MRGELPPESGSQSETDDSNRETLDDRRDPSNGAPITVRNLSVAFGDVPILDSVSLDVEPGEFIGLVGPNGAGKTTLLRTITGALAPTTGSVTIDGCNVHAVDSRTSSRLVAVVAQNTSLSFSFTVEDVVAMGRHPHRSRFSPASKTDRLAIERALDRTQTASLKDRPIDELSGGQRQRVVLARAIAQETPVLVLDEPTASLDINHQVEMLSLVRSLVADGRTVVAAIHDLDLAARYCDRLALLAGTEIQLLDSPEAVLTAETLSSVFDTTATVTTNPITRTPAVTTLPDTKERHEDRERLPDRVHLIGSGQTATTVLARLVTAGIDVSVGPVPENAVIRQATQQHDVDVLTIEPFTAVSREFETALEQAARSADVVVHAPASETLQAQIDLDSIRRATPVVDIERADSTVRTEDSDTIQPTRTERREERRETTPETVLDALCAACQDQRRLDHTEPI